MLHFSAGQIVESNGMLRFSAY